jgi:hypothetical protein
MKIVTANYAGTDTHVCIPDDLHDVLQHIATVQRGRFGVVTGHLSGIGNPKCIRPTESNITFCTNPRYDNWLARRKAGVQAVTVNDIMAHPDFKEIVAKTKGSVPALFDEAKAEVLASLEASQAGDENAYSLGQTLTHATYMAGDVPVKLHLVTEKDEDGHKRPVCNAIGLMDVDSVKLPFFEVHRKVTDHGEWKPTNSRALTLMKDAIKDASDVPDWKELSLGKGNFRTLTLDKATVYGLVREPLLVEVPAPKADVFAFICGLAEGFAAAVEALAEVMAPANVRR